MSALAPAKRVQGQHTGMVRARETADWHGSRFLFGAAGAKPAKAGDDWLEEPDDEYDDLIRRCRDGGTLQAMEG